MKIAAAIAIAIYTVMGIYTFGAVYQRIECPTAEDWRAYSCETDMKVTQALLAGIFWPLAISVILQEGGGK